MSHRSWALGAVLGIGVLGADAYVCRAETPEPERTETAKEVQRRLRLLRAWHITRALKLDGETAGKLLAIFARTDRRRQELLSRLRQARKRMARLVRSRSPDAAAVQVEVDNFVKARLDLAQLRNDEFQELRGILSPVQQAKYLLAQRRFQRQIRKMLRRVRRKP